MSISNGLKFWGLITILLIGFFWIFQNALMPFILGLVLAYILNPATDFLEDMGVNRLVASNITLFTFLISCVLFIYLFIPIISDQVNSFVVGFPEFRYKIISILNDHLGLGWQDTILKNDHDYQKYITEYAKSVFGMTGNVLNGIFSFGMMIVKQATYLIIIPVVAFYFLVDWQVFMNKIDSWLPRKHAPTIRRLISDMDDMQAAFIRGQIIVCLLQACFYMASLSVLNVDYALTLGLVTGVLTFIPYIGAGLGFIMIMMVALTQFLPDYMPLIWIGVIFAVGQTLEGYVWIPKIVGGKVSLHPIWVMFSLFAFGSILGLTGMLIAVPVTAAIGVLTRFALEQYMSSSHYSGNH